jgi:rhamnogalacturonan endolyase
MAKTELATLFQEDWSAFQVGPILRDNTARGEYMAMVVPENPNGWYHNASAGKSKDRDHSSFVVRQRGTDRVIEMPRGIHPWGPSVILTPGPKAWQDYTVTAEITVKDVRPIGLVARYQTNRDHYAALVESKVFKIVRVLEGTITVLASAPLKSGRKPVRLTLGVEGTQVTAQAGKVKLASQDGCITWGGIGLWANGAAAFGKVTVKARKEEIRRLQGAQRQETLRLLGKRRRFPAMELVAEVDVRGHAIGRQIRFADLDGDGRCELLFAVPTYHDGRKWRYNKIARLSALGLDGRVLWQRGKIRHDSIDITADLPLQAGDRGNGVEVVAAFGSSLEVLDPLTGKTKKKTLTPVPPKMEP